MAITESEIKLLAAERLTDNDDGGGQMSAVAITDGVVNNLFPDISRLDRTYGRVNLRKAYAAVQTANSDTYYGAHAIITDAPDDPRVSVTMFSTDSHTDERTASQDFIERYVITGPASSMVLYGPQLVGQRTVLVYQNENVSLPEVGQVYCLSEESGGGNVIGEQQYVRVSDITHEVVTFSDDKGSYDYRVITLEIGSPLRRTYPANDIPSRSSDHGNATIFRATNVADAAKYYGITPLEDPITAGDMVVKAQSIYGQIVPSSNVEAPVVDVTAGMGMSNPVAASAAPLWLFTSKTHPGSTTTFYLGGAIKPGSLELQWGEGPSASAIYPGNYGKFTDNGAGDIYYTEVVGSWGANSIAGADIGDHMGNVNYQTGVITMDRTLRRGSLSVSYNKWLAKAHPAGPTNEAGHTDREAITLSNRGYNYVKTLRPIPAPGTLTVDYMALGKWYRFTDDGAGVLDDTVGGVGTINYATGSIVVTLAALPDSGSTIIYTWGTAASYDIRTAEAAAVAPEITHTVAEANGIIPGSLALTWDADAVTKTATDDGKGNITGDATGRVIYGSGKFNLIPDDIPAAGALLSVDYANGALHSEAFEPTPTGDTVTITLALPPIRPGSVSLRWTALKTYSNYNYSSSRLSHHSETDNGAGGFDFDPTAVIDYSTGTVTFKALPVGNSMSYNTATRSWVNVPSIGILSGSIVATYYDDAVISAAKTESVPFPALDIELTPTTTDPIVPGSVWFDWNGKSYRDREGVLYTDLDYTTGASTAAGSIDYASGAASLTGYSGGPKALSVKSLLTRRGEWLADKLYFRTPGAPLRPASLYLRANKPDGSLVTVTGDTAGNLSAPGVSGTINWETGVVDVAFGALVADTTLSAEEKAEVWYNPADIDGDGNIWHPAPILPGTAKFNAVVYSTMPLDASILGLDPVRLPIDGRVPVIRSGDVVVIHNTKTDVMPGGLVASQTVALTRASIDACYLIDATGAGVDSAQYSIDKAAGSVTMDAALDLTGYTEPLSAVHRVEEMALVNEAEINGTLTLVGALSKDFTAGDTFVSSALIFGDMASRAHHLFSQITWSNTWADQRSGSPTSAQYNDLLYPIAVNNKNAIKERWALVFTGSTTYNVLGEFSGVIATGTTAADCAPINPVTGEPYFTVLAAGWGAGWSTNNVLRFNTDAANAPIWVARTTISGTPTATDDSFRIEVRGDAD